MDIRLPRLVLARRNCAACYAGLDSYRIRHSALPANPPLNGKEVHDESGAYPLSAEGIGVEGGVDA